jgi:hypothetical protein
MKETILGVVRHILTAGGGFLTANGLATADEVNLIVGGLIAAFGLVWSILQKRKLA